MPHLEREKFIVHLCLVTETFPPDVNGVAMTLARLVAGLHRRGHRITVARPRPHDGFGLPLDASTHQALHLPGFSVPGYSLLRLGWPAHRRLRAAWRRDRPDLVHVATEGPLGWSAVRTARSLGLPVTSTFHTNFHHYSGHYGISLLQRPVLAYLRYLHNRTAVTLSPTAKLNEELAAAGFQNLDVLGRGVDLELFNPQRRDEGWRRSVGAGPNDLLVVHVSRLAKEKNYPLLARTFAALRSVHPRTRLVVVSDGPERARLQRLLPEALFTGFLSPEALATAYASADLFPYPSLTETFGNVLTEALASGLATVAFDYAAAAQYVRNGENGVTVPFGDETNFIAAAVRLAQDADLRSRLGAGGRATAEHIPWSQVILRFEAILLSLSQANHRGSP